MNKARKKNRRLIFQMAVILIPVFFIMIGAVMYSMYRGAENSFLEAQNKKMGEKLSEESEWLTFSETYLIDCWEQYPDSIEREISEEQVAEISEKMDSIAESSFAESSFAEARFYEWFVEQSEDMQKITASYIYDNTFTLIECDCIYGAVERLLLFDVNSPNEGFVFWDYDQNNNARKVGDRLDIDFSDHPALSEIAEGKTTDIVFEQAEDFITEGSQYIGYKPVIINGSVRAVFAISYDWSELRSSLLRTVRISFIINIAGMVAALVIQFFFFRRKAVAPLNKIQSGVREYIETKDSEAVIAKMSEIKEKNEFGILSEDISDLAMAIDKYTGEIMTLTGERERAAAELDMARSIQAGQLPRSLPENTVFDIYASMTPAKEVGGDFYDFFFVDDDHLALVIADVSEKGIPAALFMMMSKNMINNYTSMGLSPAEVMNRTNASICKNNKEFMFVTVWMGILEISTGKVTAVNAGHEYPMLRQPGGAFEKLNDDHNFVIGGRAGKTFKQYEFTLQKGGSLFVFTDGLTEARNADQKMFREERLIEALNKEPDASPRDLLELVHREVNAFVGDAPQFDDLTMLGIKLL